MPLLDRGELVPKTRRITGFYLHELHGSVAIARRQKLHRPRGTVDLEAEGIQGVDDPRPGGISAQRFG